MKKILVIIDGMEDIEYEEFSGKTPLDYAETRYISTMKRLSPGSFTPNNMEPDSFCCILNMLGVSPEKIPQSRAFVEAVANGVPVGQNDLVLRLNTVGVRDGILSESGAAGDGDSFRFVPYPVKHLGSYKNIMVITGGKQYIATLKTFPPHQNIGRSITELLSGGNVLGEQLRLMTEETLSAQAGRMTLMPWSPSVYAELPSFEKIHGATGAVVCAEDVVAGIALQMGMELVKTPGATGDVDTALGEKTEAALDCLDRHDFVLLHLNGADEAAHRRNFLEKADFIKRVDTEVVGRLMGHLPRGCKMTVTSDHATLCATGKHSSAPVEVFFTKDVEI